MSRIIQFVYASIAYLLFLVTFLSLIAFAEDLVPWGIDRPDDGTPIGLACAINLGLIALFGIQHNVMARPWFKARWTRLVPRPIERATFVLATCAVFGVMFWQWRPIGEAVWTVEHPWARAAIFAASTFGWLLALWSTFVIDHFELFGLSQAWRHLRGTEAPPPHFVERSVYRRMRHPLMTGILLGIWATPAMSVGHLLFAGVMTAWVLFAIRLEERDLVQALGAPYERYRRRVPSLLPTRLGATIVAAPGSADPGKA